MGQPQSRSESQSQTMYGGASSGPIVALPFRGRGVYPWPLPTLYHAARGCKTAGDDLYRPETRVTPFPLENGLALAEYVY